MTTAASPWRQTVKQAMAATVPRRRLLVHGPAGSTQVALTFDDGPHPEHTPRLLDVLRELNVKATFFVVGREVERNPRLVQRIAAEGHAVGHHSFSHSEPASTSPEQLLEEAHRTSDLLHDLLGSRPTLFRPPHGKLTAGKLLGLWRMGQCIVLWSTDPRDYKQLSAAGLVEWFRDNPLLGGEVVLLHDRLPHAAGALPQIVQNARVHRPDLVFSTVASWVQA